MTDHKETLSELMELRKRKGWTLRELARRSDIPLSTLEKLSSGRTKAPHPATLSAIRQALLVKEEPEGAWDYLSEGMPSHLLTYAGAASRLPGLGAENLLKTAGHEDTEALEKRLASLEAEVRELKAVLADLKEKCL